MEKSCLNCKYYRNAPTAVTQNRMRCFKQASPVDGNADSWRGNAELQRQEGWLSSLMMGLCGRRGRWFEPRTLKSKPQADYKK